jgi:hypothetical protein
MFFFDFHQTWFKQGMTMPQRDQRRLSMSSFSSWREKSLLSEDQNLLPFCWTYGTGELIEELARIDEILNLSELLQQPTDVPDHFGIDMCFEEAFIDSHEMLVMMLDRVTTYWNKNGQQDVLKLHRSKSTENILEVDPENQKAYFADVMLASYKNANNIYKLMRDSLLRMRSLYENLKPETQALVKCCSYKIQLQNSMLAQKVVQRASSKSFTFMPVCGFSLQPQDKEKDTLRDRITTIDVQMSRLRMERDLILNKLMDEQVVHDALEVCDVLRDILMQGRTIDDSNEALKYATDIIDPQKHVLKMYSWSFENTLQAFPDVYPSTCTQEEAAEFLSNMLDALEKDRQQLNMMKIKKLKFSM